MKKSRLAAFMESYCSNLHCFDLVPCDLHTENSEQPQPEQSQPIELKKDSKVENKIENDIFDTIRASCGTLIDHSLYVKIDKEAAKKFAQAHSVAEIRTCSDNRRGFPLKFSSIRQVRLFSLFSSSLLSSLFSFSSFLSLLFSPLFSLRFSCLLFSSFSLP